MRKSGEPYYSHPIVVANMVANNIFRSDAITGALLHNTLEDTTLTFSEIEYEFGGRVAQIVDRLTRKIDPDTGKKMSAGECLLRTQELGDNEAVLIKMCDRLHNTSTIGSLSKEKQEKIINETIEYFTFLFFYGKHMNNSNKINEILISSMESLGFKNTKYFDINSILSCEDSYFDKNLYAPNLQNKISQ